MRTVVALVPAVLLLALAPDVPRARADAPPNAPTNAPTNALEDAAPPSQDLATDRASDRPIFQAMAVARAPLDRSYGAVIAYSPARPLALELRIALDESASVELGLGIAVYFFGKAFDGLLLRATPQAVLSGDGAASDARLRVDVELGYALASGHFIVEFDAGAAYRHPTGAAGGSPFAILLGLRGGIAY